MNASKYLIKVGRRGNQTAGTVLTLWSIPEVMMKPKIQVTLFVAILLLVACGPERRDPASNNITVTGSGNIVSKELDLSGFDRAEAALHFNITIHQGEEYRAVIYSDDNFIDFIDVEQVGTILSFGLDPAYAYNFYDVTLRAELTMPQPAGLELAGSSRATLANLDLPGTFQAELSGSTALSGELRAGTLSLDVGQSAQVEIVGAGHRLLLESCGNSLSDLADFAVEEAMVEASCSGTAVVNAGELLDVDASQFARVYYVGDPTRGDRMAHESATIRRQS